MNYCFSLISQSLYNRYVHAGSGSIVLRVFTDEEPDRVYLVPKIFSQMESWMYADLIFDLLS